MKTKRALEKKFVKLFKAPYTYVKDSLIRWCPGHKSAGETYIPIRKADPSLVIKVYRFQKSGGLRLYCFKGVKADLWETENRVCAKSGGQTRIMLCFCSSGVGDCRKAKFPIRLQTWVSPT